MTLRTVNVIEFSEDSASQILGVASYPDDEAGNKEAEERYIDLITENMTLLEKAEFDQEAKNDALEEGYYCVGGWCIVITHSTV